MSKRKLIIKNDERVFMGTGAKGSILAFWKWIEKSREQLKISILEDTIICTDEESLKKCRDTAIKYGIALV